MPVKKKTSKKTTSKNAAQVTSRNINFDDDEWPEPETPAPTKPTPQNPETYGFSPITIPDETIDLDDADKRNHALKVYRSFCLNLIAHEDRSRGYTRWCLGVVLNRLKPINGGAKSIPHGEFAKFLKDIGVKPDLAEEIRWAAVAVAESKAPTTGWTSMRKTALEFRASQQPAPKPHIEEETETDDDPFAVIPDNQKETVPGFDDLSFDEKRAIAKEAFGINIPKQSKTPVKPQPSPSPSPETTTMTPEKFHKLFARVNKLLADKVDAVWEWGAGDKDKTQKEIEEAINKATAAEAKLKTYREMLKAKLAEIKTKGAA